MTTATAAANAALAYLPHINKSSDAGSYYITRKHYLHTSTAATVAVVAAAALFSHVIDFIAEEQLTGEQGILLLSLPFLLTSSAALYQLVSLL